MAKEHHLTCLRGDDLPEDDDVVVGPVEMTWRTLASCRAMTDAGTADEIAGVMAYLDYAARIASWLPRDGQQAWLDEDLSDIDELVTAIHNHLSATVTERRE